MDDKVDPLSDMDELERGLRSGIRFSPFAMGQVADTIAALRASLRKVTAERDEACRRRDYWHGMAEGKDWVRGYLLTCTERDTEKDRAEAAEAEVATLRAELDAARGRVKPLSWFEVEKSRLGGKYTADGYTIRYIEGLWLLDFAGATKSDWRFTDLEAAKAAAQADYTARILAAMEARDVKGEG